MRHLCFTTLSGEMGEALYFSGKRDHRRDPDRDGYGLRATTP